MKKIIAVALAAATLGTVFAASASDAEARRWHRGLGIGIGIALAGAPYVFGPALDEPVRYATDCRYVDRYDRYGNYLGARRICRVLPY